MQDWLIGVINQFGYLGIAFLILLENVFPPIPSELILTFSGFLTTVSNLNLWLAALSATAGSMSGAILLYEVGRMLPQRKIILFTQKHKRIFHLKEADLKRSADWMTRKGGSAVFLCRFVPVVRSLISIPAGAAHMRLWEFLLYSTLGTMIWNAVLISLGAMAGNHWEAITGYMKTYSYVIGALAAVALVWFILHKVRKNTKRPAALKPPDRAEGNNAASNN